MINVYFKMLHIQTPLYRFQNLERIYESIPKHEDIIWHVSKIKSRKTPESYVWDDPRVRLYDVDCLDTDTVAKRNISFNEMKEGWFHLLDDDTTFYDNMYKVYSNIKNSDLKMVIGAQLDEKKRLRLRPSYPRSGYIDTGNVLAHSSLTEKVAWIKSDPYPRDYFFWKNCFVHSGEENVLLINEVISHYNMLR